MFIVVCANFNSNFDFNWKSNYIFGFVTHSDHIYYQWSRGISSIFSQLKSFWLSFSNLRFISNNIYHFLPFIGFIGTTCSQKSYLFSLKNVRQYYLLTFYIQFINFIFCFYLWLTYRFTVSISFTYSILGISW